MLGNIPKWMINGSGYYDMDAVFHPHNKNEKCYKEYDIKVYGDKLNDN